MIYNKQHKKILLIPYGKVSYDNILPLEIPYLLHSHFLLHNHNLACLTNNYIKDPYGAP